MNRQPQDTDASFGHVLTGGIQDVSALLPLLGTEQCEEHVGSALIKGYLYAAAAPLSVFGSLGIVRCGIKAVVASCNFNLWGEKIMGAQKLVDAGFTSGAGTALSLILWKDGHHLIEPELSAMLDRLHITNMAGLSVDGTSWTWNLNMLGASIISAIASLTPYIYLIKVGWESFSVRWLLPLARSVGSLVTANLIQIVLQERLLEILRHRLVFLALNDDIRRISPAYLPSDWNTRWNNEVSSELALYALEVHLRNQLDEEHGDEHTLEDIEALSSMPDQKQQALIMIRKSLNTTMKHHFLPVTNLHKWILILVRTFILVGLGFSVAGYIGSFSLVQSASSTHALIWLVMEVVLSLLRVTLWSWNPKEDDTTLKFTLKLSANTPLVTCNKFSEELEEEKTIPLTRHQEFLQDITSFVGMLKPLEDITEGAELYYTLSVCNKTKKRVLYITISKGGTTRTLVQQQDSEETLCYAATLEVQDVRDSSTQAWVTLQHQLSMEDHPLTRVWSFGRGITDHCESILNGLSQVRATDIVALGRIKGTWHTFK